MPAKRNDTSSHSDSPAVRNTSASASVCNGSPRLMRPVRNAPGRPMARPRPMAPKTSRPASASRLPCTACPDRPMAKISASEKAIMPQASSIATIPLIVSTNGPFAPDCRMMSSVAAGAVAVATAPITSAAPGGTPNSQAPADTRASVTATIAIEISRIARPCAASVLRVSDPPSRNATMVSAMTDSASYQATASAGIRSNPAPPMTTPTSNSSVTRGSRVRVPSQSAARPARKSPASTRKLCESAMRPPFSPPASSGPASRRIAPPAAAPVHRPPSARQ